MEKNDQQSYEAKPNEKSGNSDMHHSYGGEYRMGEFRSERDPKTPKKLKSQSRKTTAIALGILMLVSLGLVGFEAVATKAPDAVLPANQASKSLLILSQEREREAAGLLASLNADRTGGDPADSSALKEANRIQASKINSLKRQLVEANQKLHEVKSHLFTKGDPTDRARLAEICQELVEKERGNQELKDKLSRLENENEQSIQKIKRMEHTIDALAAMTDNQRETKEQAILSFQEQLDQLKNNANQEKSELQKMIDDLAEEQQQLKEALAEKLASIKNLESEVSLQYTMLEEKDKEIQAQAQLYTAAEKKLNKQLQDLIATIELETFTNHNLRTDHEVAEAKLSAQINYTKTIEERLHAADARARAEMEKLNNMQLALAREYLDLEGVLTVYADSHNKFEGKHKKLAQLAKDEKGRADLLDKELQNALAAVDAEQQRGLCLEDELHKTSAQVANLTAELAAHEHLLNSKHQELETMAYSHASLKDQLNERIKQLVASLEDEQKRGAQKEQSIRDLAINYELEKNHSQELDHHLKQSVETAESLAKRLSEMEDELSHKAETLAALEDRLQDKQYDINTANSQIKQLSEAIEAEKLRTRELHQALVTALEKNEGDQSYINQLKEQIAENSDALTMIQDRMTDKKKAIDNMNDRLTELTDALEAEKQKNLDLLRELATASAEKDSAHGHSSTLEAEIASNNRKIVSLQDAIADKQHEVRDLLAKYQGLASQLDAERTRAMDLEEELDNVSSKHDAEYYRANTLEQTVEDHQKQISNLLNQLNEISDNYEQERTKSSELEKNLFKVMSKLDQKEQTLDQILSDNKVTDEEFSTLKKEIDALRKERDAFAKERDLLSKKNAQQMKLLLQQQEIVQKLSGDIKSQQEAMKQIEQNRSEIQEQAATSKILGENEPKSTHATVNGSSMGSNEKGDNTTHKVKHGETLTTISVAYYGTPNRWIDIYNANTDQLKSKNDPVRSGMTLRIPR